MDVYGYPTYQYNQSDELAKQMFAQQTLAPYNRDVPEPHAMPAPTGAPWNMQGLSWGMPCPPQLMHFTAQPPIIEGEFKPVIHCKRKSYDLDPPIPAKQLITEEKMTAHFNGMHISSDYTTHSLSSDEVMDVGMDTPSVSERLKGHTIVLSDEIKKLKDEPLLPAALIERLEKPCMSLVVWKPKENIIEKKLKEVEDEEKYQNKEEQQTRRNGVLVPDYADMDVEM